MALPVVQAASREDISNCRRRRREQKGAMRYRHASIQIHIYASEAHSTPLKGLDERLRNLAAH